MTAKEVNKKFPYIPSTLTDSKEKMLKELGIESVDEIIDELIPEEIRFKGEMDLPDPILSEMELKQHIEEEILDKNESVEDKSNFLGAGCYDHYVPAICDEINSRSEFLTAYCGGTYSDHGKMQAIFEYTSQMAELLDLGVVSYTLYDGGQAAASSLRMTLRITGRSELLLPKTMNPEILNQVENYMKGLADIKFVDYEDDTGNIDLNDLKNKLSKDTAAVFIENPSYLGFIEENVQKIAKLAHKKDALFVVYADPSSLGILETPANYGADLVCGDIQPLGIHMHYGGGCGGYIASRHEKKFISEYPTYLYGIAPTDKRDEFGWGRALNERTSHESREEANEYFGTETGLWAITAGVYLALMGPEGMRELGENIIYKMNYAKEKLAKIPGVNLDIFNNYNFKEFIVNFDESDKTIEEINDELSNYNIFGGKDLSSDFPFLGNSALYCVTEKTTIKDIENLSSALKEIV